MGKHLLSFDHVQARAGAYARAYRGLQIVEVDRIVGSVGRSYVLDGRFRNRATVPGWENASEHRSNRVRQLFERENVPPIDLYQIDNAFFVLDGHHRVKVAIERGQEYIEAHVVEYVPDRNDPANAPYYERLAFTSATGLREVHATESGRYPRLLNRIRDHARSLERQPGGSLYEVFSQIAPVPARAIQATDEHPGVREAARDWYESEFRPVVEVLTAARIADRFPGRAAGDLYGYVCDHRWYLSERRGWDVGIDDALVDFIQRNAARPLVDALLDPVIALGSEVLDDERAGSILPFDSPTAHDWLALATGVLALPIAFLRGLRPQHYQFPRFRLGEVLEPAQPDA